MSGKGNISKQPKPKKRIVRKAKHNKSRVNGTSIANNNNARPSITDAIQDMKKALNNQKNVIAKLQSENIELKVELQQLKFGIQNRAISSSSQMSHSETHLFQNTSEIRNRSRTNSVRGLSTASFSPPPRALPSLPGKYAGISAKKNGSISIVFQKH